MTSPAPFDTLFRQAEHGVLPLGELFNGAQALTEQGAQPEAARLYQTWLAHTPSPLAYAAWFNLAVVLGGVGDNEGSVRAYLQAIELHPRFVEARLNLGTVYEHLGRPD